MKRLLLGGVIALLWMGCDSNRGSLSLEMDYDRPNQLRSLRLGIVPDDWEGSADSIEAWTQRVGGTVLSRERKEERRIRLLLRVPTAQADSFVRKIKALGYVFAEEVERADVGRQVSDLEEQLRLKEEALARQREFLQKARTPSEIMEAEEAISKTLQARDSIRRLIEQIRAETGTVRIEVQLVNQRYAAIGGGGSFWKQFFKGFVEGWDLFKGFLIVMSYIWWLWAGLAILIYLAIRHQRRREQKAQISPQPPSESGT